MSKLPKQPKQPPDEPSSGGARRRRRTASTVRSPLDVPGVDLHLTTDEVVNLVREGRERYG